MDKNKEISEEDYIDGYIAGFMSTREGQNGEFGNFDDISWNTPDDSERKILKEKLRKVAEEMLMEWQ